MPVSSTPTSTFRHTLWGIVGAPLGAMVVLAAALLWQISQLLTTTTWVDHTDQVISAAYAYERTTMATQASVRGYLLTRREPMLATWEQTRLHADGSVAALRALVVDNPAQLARLAEIQRRFDAWRAFAQSAIDARRADPLAPPQRSAQIEGGSAAFAPLDDQFSQFIAVEQALRAERLRTAERTARALSVLSGVLTLAVGLALALYGRRRVQVLARAYETALGDVAAQATALEAAAVERQQLLEQEQAARVRAEVASRLKDEFLATVSHELRTPLTAVLGWANILRSGRAPEGPRRDKALETIERNARAQARLIDDLLDVSRIVAGKLRLDLRPIDPARAIEAAIEAMRPAAEARGTRLQVVLDPHAGPLLGDADRLQQIVWNLVANAVKFTPKGGRVLVRLQRNASHVEITVEDNGIGVDPAFLPAMFERFRQADASVERKYEGLGLGLAIVRHLSELHGGTVMAESEGLGRGTRITVRLPISPVEAAPGYPPPTHPTRSAEDAAFAPGNELEGTSVLLVDDEPDTRALLAEVLTQAGATVQAVASAAEALTALTADVRPDVLVSDIGMPDASGYALIAQLRALPPERGGRIPAVALTAYARPEDRAQALRAGFVAHVAKPIEPTELIAVVASAAGRFRVSH